MTNEKIKIEDNFLDQEDFNSLQQILTTPSGFSWIFNSAIDHPDNEDKFQFIHIFYADNVPRSNGFEQLRPFLVALDPISIWRIKTNLLTRTATIVKNTFHTDMSHLSEEKLKQWTTSIFYVNTNNGYTIFEDNTKIESVANRMLTFPANMKHTGTSCTDEKIRVIINFNYFK
jgi:hypothetical protein